MNYEFILPARFLERPNRFIAYADLDGVTVTCHVKNTGRCRELLVPGVRVFLQHHPDAAALKRKTEYSLISVCKETGGHTELINLDSQAPNTVAWEWLSQGGMGSISQLRREVTYGESRIDLAFMKDRQPAFMEVKGVTLEQDGVARFPDAPTERGIKHLNELARAAAEGYHASILFVIAMKGVSSFAPNWATHPAFGDALIHAAGCGVQILARDCIVSPDSLRIDKTVPIDLSRR